MRYRTLPVRQASRKMTDIFKGYNRNLRITDGEFFDMKNMSSDHYPLLSPRGRRGVYTKTASPQGIIAKDEVCYVDGADFVIGENRIDMGLSVEAEDCPKQLVSMGAYVIVMPDRKYINTIDPSDHGDIEASYVSNSTVTFEMCSLTGETIENYTASTECPADPANSTYWLDTSVTPNVLKQYSSTTKIWVSIMTTYVKINAAGIGKNFSRHDGVTISGIQDPKLQDLNATMVIWEKNDDYIVVTGLLDKTITQSESVTVLRQMPYMDFLVESNNRLWGCRYGKARNGEIVNELYACKLGDFRNWNCFMGISTDSYAASCGTDGPFTGAAAPKGRPIFWKEGYCHEVYGSYPANFQIQDTACRGVQKGCHGSLAIVNEVLYYKSVTGICAFDGSLPEDISYALANEVFTDAVAAAHGNKYYISMKDASGEWQLFVYDCMKKLWHKEDHLHALDFCSLGGELYCIDADSKNIITMLGSGTQDEAPVEWMVETGELGLSSPDMKYVSGITIRMTMEADTEMNLYAQYEANGEWVHLCNVRSTSLRSFSVPVRPRRCDHIKLRMEAKGPGIIYSITKTFTQGSDRS